MRGTDDVRGGGSRGVRAAGAVLAALALAAGGCTRFDVRSSRRPDADFAALRTFAWLPAAEAEPADQRVNDRGIDRRIRAATEEELRAKGYQPAGAEPADFLLNYRVATSPDDALHVGRRYTSDVWVGWPGADRVHESYDVGTLYVAVLDGRTKRMIWVGAAQARLLPHISYERRVKRVDAAVHEILEPFPAR